MRCTLSGRRCVFCKGNKMKFPHVLHLAHSLPETSRAHCIALSPWIVLWGSTYRKVLGQENSDEVAWQGPCRSVLLSVVRAVLSRALHVNSLLNRLHKCSIFRTRITSQMLHSRWRMFLRVSLHELWVTTSHKDVCLIGGNIWIQDESYFCIKWTVHKIHRSTQKVLVSSLFII